MAWETIIRSLNSTHLCVDTSQDWTKNTSMKNRPIDFNSLVNASNIISVSVPGKLTLKNEFMKLPSEPIVVSGELFLNEIVRTCFRDSSIIQSLNATFLIPAGVQHTIPTDVCIIFSGDASLLPFIHPSSSMCLPSEWNKTTRVGVLSDEKSGCEAGTIINAMYPQYRQMFHLTDFEQKKLIQRLVVLNFILCLLFAVVLVARCIMQRQRVNLVKNDAYVSYELT